MATGGRIFYSTFNFILLVAFFYLTLKPVAREFFYSRREKVKKNIAASAWKLRKARLNFKEVKNRHECLANDIKSREEGIGEDSRRECDLILEEAQKRRDHVLGTAKQICERESKNSIRLLREKLISEAFAKARSTIGSSISGPVRKRMVERGLGEFSEELSSGKISIDTLGCSGREGNLS